MTKRRNAFLITAICLFLAILLAFGGVLLARADYRYRLGLLFRHYGEPNLQAVAPTGLIDRVLAELLNDPRVEANDQLLLINATHPIPDDFVPTLTDRMGHSLQPIAAQSFDELARAILARSEEELLIRSAYRNRMEQAEELAANGDGLAARPGYSEHELGLALDLCLAGYGGMSFLKTEAGRLVNDQCGEYGFIIRYPNGKASVTGFAYEPWHVRYVGAPHAEIIADAGLTLEEYLDLLSPDVWYQSGDCLILRTASETVPTPNQFTSCTVSRDNLGYRVFTFLEGRC